MEQKFQDIQELTDPHLLYHAINLTVELKYAIPVKKIYKLLVAIQKHSPENEITSTDVLQVLQILKLQINKKAFSDETNEPPTSLKEKIKSILRLLGVELENNELNRILNGQIKVEDALPKYAQKAWYMIFDIDSASGKARPVEYVVDHLLLFSEELAVSEMEQKLQYQREQRQLFVIQSRMNQNYYDFLTQEEKKQLDIKDQQIHSKEESPRELEEKLVKLRLYIAHMQGYDRDLDRDGTRGIDLSTGYVVDYDDAYIEDKRHGCVIEDKEYDGIDLEDLK